MWHDPPFSQENKATKRVVRVEVGGERGEKRVEQNFKKKRGEGGQVCNIEGLYKIGVRNPLTSMV